MASSRAILLFFAATIFVDQVFALSSYEAERQARRRAALANDLEDGKDSDDVNSLRKCVRALVGDVVAIRRSLRDMRRSDGGSFNAGMGQMQENEMQMQMILDTDDLHHGGNPGQQYLPGNQMNGVPNLAYPNPQSPPYGGYDQQPQQPQQSQYQPFKQSDQPGIPYGIPQNSGMPMNPMGMSGSRAYSNPSNMAVHQMEAIRRLLNENTGESDTGIKSPSSSRTGTNHGRFLHSRSALMGNRAY